MGYKNNIADKCQSVEFKQDFDLLSYFEVQKTFVSLTLGILKFLKLPTTACLIEKDYEFFSNRIKLS